MTVERRRALVDETAQGRTRAAPLRPAEDPALSSAEIAPPTRVRIARLFERRPWVALRIACDAVLLLAAVGAAHLGAASAGLSSEAEPLLWVFAPLTLVLLTVSGAYQEGIKPRIFHRVWQVAGAISLSAMFMIVINAFATGAENMPALVGRLWFFAGAYVIGGRIVLGIVQRRARRNHVAGTSALIVGAGRIGAQVEQRLLEYPTLGLRPVGFLDDDPLPRNSGTALRSPVLGVPSDLAAVAAATGAGHVIFAFSSSSDEQLVGLVKTCERLGLEATLIPRMFEEMTVRTDIEHIGGLPLCELRFVNPRGWQFVVKHGLDRLVATMLLALLSPVLFVAAAAVKLTSKGPVFFRQQRVGRDGDVFSIIKLRTMEGTPEEHGDANAGWATAAIGLAETRVVAPRRVTRVGRLLRAYSIDELPQLLNVLAGSMSLVGPRPEIPQYVEQFATSIPFYEDRLRVRPGLTGWAQVHDLELSRPLADRVEWDNYYIDNWSLALDFKILLMTVGVLRGRPADLTLT